MPTWLYALLQDNQAVLYLDEEESFPLTSLIEEALVIATSFQKKKRPILVVKQNLYQAQRLFDRLSPLVEKSECALFGADESLRVESIASSPELTAMQVETLSSLCNVSKQIVITCPSALLRYLPNPEVFQSLCMNLKVGNEYSMDSIKEKLRAAGYTQTSHIDQPLTFAARGGIIDVYSINHEYPIRIEFFDTEIESLRYFDVLSQKTIETIEEVDIVPASTVLFSRKEIEELKQAAKEKGKKEDAILQEHVDLDIQSLEKYVFDKSFYPYMGLLKESSSLLDYMDNPLVILSDEEMIRNAEKNLHVDTITYIQEMVTEKKLLPIYDLWHDLDRLLNKRRIVKAEVFMDNDAHIEEFTMPNEPLASRLAMIQKAGKSVIAVMDNEMHRIIDTCIEENIPYSLLAEDGEIKEGINLYLDDFVQGFSLAQKKIAVFSAKEIFGIHHHKSRYENKFRHAEVIHGYEELTPGDYIVHAQYGVGQYLGIETREVKGNYRDFLKIVYRGNAELLVPLEQFRQVRKFVSREGVVPRLNKLGTTEWQKTKERIQESVNDIAERLIALYANRKEKIGHAFSKDNELTKKFEDAFAFDLTKDQIKAVEDIKADMESDKPMDRLVCGDVGFGKTEVAVRASFKAVSDSKQVAVLCPTTILSQQHYKTFMSRYEGYPVEIAVLNRFVTPAKQKQILEKLKEGKIDIVVGTHRILSKDVKFKDLGLLIVDEEQRFGVEHKEVIKEMKNEVDVLSLSATPIPRTLQMSLIGVRSLSQLETPPMNRYSVQTYVVEKKEQLIYEAIQKELARNGQVFYLYNNISTIYAVARNIQSHIPDVRVAVVHGQMNREDIEDTMLKVEKHEIDVLVCTTIVENGIDIPNVNTILIDNAQNFGLAQLYQIKGRVGRSDRIAYAYLLIPPRRKLNEVAEKRLQAIKEFARLGSGYKIAMRDLTIRGAGDLLGAEQSGFIDTVGIDMYIEMLEEAIALKKGEKKEKEEMEVKTNVKETGYIPKSFAPDDFDKIGMYQKIDAIKDPESLQEYKESIIDQYGKLPKEVEQVFHKRDFDLSLKEAHVDGFKEYLDRAEITFTKDYSQSIDGVKLFEAFNNLSKDISLRYKDEKITAVAPESIYTMEMMMNIIHVAKEVKDAH